MRIAYFTESLLPHVDGVSRTLARLFRTLEGREIEFRVYAPFQPEPEISWHDRVRPVPFVRFPPYPDYRISLPFARGVGKELRHWRPDLVHLVSPTPMASWAARWARQNDIPAVASFHTHFVSYFRFYGVPRLEGFGWALLRRFYARSDRVYVPSHALIRELAEHGITHTELWSRGIDRSHFGPEHRDPVLRATVGADEQHPLLLLVSRLVREKDLADLVEMHDILRKRDVPFRLVLVGDGPMREELEAGLPDAYFAGHQSGRNLARWYASADVFVFPSTTETFGNVVLESLASGVPAVVADRGGPPEQIAAGQNGLIAPANDPTGLADRVEMLLRDPEARERMGRAALAGAARHDWDAVNGELIASYREVIRSSPGGG